MADDFDKRYPLHAKVVAVRDEKNVLEKFLRWLETNETFRLVRADGAGIRTAGRPRPAAGRCQWRAARCDP